MHNIRNYIGFKLFPAVLLFTPFYTMMLHSHMYVIFFLFQGTSGMNASLTFSLDIKDQGTHVLKRDKVRQKSNYSRQYGIGRM